MPWVKLTDDWYDDPDIVAAGPLGLAMWVVGLSWCARNLTDGHIPLSQVRKLLDLEDIAVNGERCRADDIAARLVDLGKWTPTDRGYAINNYHRYQPARAKVLAEREKDRQRKATRAGNLLPDDTDVPEATEAPPIPNGFRPESGTEPPRNPGRPGPVPDSDPASRRPVDSTDDAATAVDDDELSTVPAETWDRYARLQLERQPEQNIKSRSGYMRKIRRTAPAEHGAQAARWYADFKVDARQLAEWLIDGQPSVYAQRRQPGASA